MDKEITKQLLNDLQNIKIKTETKSNHSSM